MIKGALLKFADDGKWYLAKEMSSMEGARLIPAYTKAAWVKWSDGKPVECIMRQVGQRLPDRDELGDLDIGYWETSPDGQPKDCWQNTRFVYFLHPTSYGPPYTFYTSSWDGRMSLSDLALQIIRARHIRPGALPVVELCAAPFPTKLDGKSKPVFKIVTWRDKVLDDRPDFFRTKTKASSSVKIATQENLDNDILW
jgi:hypothetical protein